MFFILVMELISRKISTTDALRNIMYADDLVIVGEHREELQGALEELNEMFKKHGLKMNLDKTEVMWVGKQREELNIMLEEKDIKQTISVEIYLKTGEWMWMWRCDAEYNQERMHGER